MHLNKFDYSPYHLRTGNNNAPILLRAKKENPPQLEDSLFLMKSAPIELGLRVCLFHFFAEGDKMLKQTQHHITSSGGHGFRMPLNTH